MRLVMRDGPGEVVVSYMWLPTFLGLDSVFMKKLEDAIQPLLVGKDLTDETLDAAHEAVLDFIEKTHPEIVGLRTYIDALKFVEGPS